MLVQFKFNKMYFAITVILFIIECLIAKFIDDHFIRPYVGDYLVVILIYCFTKAFFHIPVLNNAVGVLIFAYITEILQYLNIVKRLGLAHVKLARIIIGTQFAWVDLIAYTLGIGTVLLIEKLIKKQTFSKLY